MCGPMALGVAMLVTTVLAGAYQADAANKAGDAQEEQSKENAKAAKEAGRSTTLAAQVEEDRRRQQTRQMLASQRVAFAANNVDMSTGTPVELLGDTAAIGEQDALTIRANAARQAWGYSVESNNELNAGRMAKTGASNAAMGTYLTTAGSAMSQGYSLYGNRSVATGNTLGPSRGSVNTYKPPKRYG